MDCFHQNLVFKFEYKFSQTNDNQDGQQNGRRLSICFFGQSTLIIYYLITSKFYTWITFIKLSVCADNQDGRQNGRHLSVYTCGHSNLVIYHPISSKFYIWTTFIKLLFMSEYGFCRIRIPFSLMGIRRGPLSESDCSSYHGVNSFNLICLKFDCLVVIFKQ